MKIEEHNQLMNNIMKYLKIVEDKSSMQLTHSEYETLINDAVERIFIKDCETFTTFISGECKVLIVEAFLQINIDVFCGCLDTRLPRFFFLFQHMRLITIGLNEITF